MVVNNHAWDKSLMFFVMVNTKDIEILSECHVRNVLVSYAFIEKFGGTLSEVADNFERVFLDSGAFTAFTQGTEVDMDEYFSFVREERANTSVVAQLDVYNNLPRTLANWQEGHRRGIDWMIPILQGDWAISVKKFEAMGYPFDYAAIGGRTMINKGKDLVQSVQSLPMNYKYHGFAKVDFYLMGKGLLYSADSSSWASGHRFGRVSVWDKSRRNDGVSVGRIGKDDKVGLRWAYHMHERDALRCGIDEEGLMHQNLDDVRKAYIAFYYRPRLRELGLFDANFYN